MTSEKYRQAVTIGEPKPHNATIELVAYDPQWPRAYARLEADIRDALGTVALRVEHVGSTSVPGLAAKPVIDIVVAVADPDDEASFVAPLEARGFVLRLREPVWFRHRLLKAPFAAGNVHVFASDCEEVDRMIAFRDRID